MQVFTNKILTCSSSVVIHLCTFNATKHTSFSQEFAYKIFHQLLFSKKLVCKLGEFLNWFTGHSLVKIKIK